MSRSGSTRGDGPSYGAALLERLNEELDRELGGGGGAASHRSGSVGRSSSAQYNTGSAMASTRITVPTPHSYYGGSEYAAAESVGNGMSYATTKSTPASSLRHSANDGGGDPSLSAAHAAARAAIRTAVKGRDLAVPSSPTSAFRNDEVAELRAALLTATQALHQAQKDRKTEEANAIAARAERDDHARLVASLRSTIESNEALAEQRCAALQRRLQAAESERDDAQRTVTAASDTLDAMQRRFADLKRRANSLATDLEEAHAARAQVTAERDAAREALRNAKREIKRLDKFVASDLQPFLESAHNYVERRKAASASSALNTSTFSVGSVPPPPPPRDWSESGGDDDSRGGVGGLMGTASLFEGLSVIDQLQSSNRSGSASAGGGRRGSAATDTPSMGLSGPTSSTYERAKQRILTMRPDA